MEKKLRNALGETVLGVFKERKLPPTKPRRLARMLKLDISDVPDLTDVLEKLVEAGRLLRLSRKRYALPSSSSVVSGKLQMNDRGFGFVIPEADSGKTNDIYISPGDLHGAMHGDKVLVRLKRGRRGRPSQGPSGEIVNILEHSEELYVGKVYKAPSGLLVSAVRGSYTVDVRVVKRDSLGAEPGEKVALRIVRGPRGTARPQGVIVERLGEAGTYEAEEAALFIEFALPKEFPADVLTEEKRISGAISEAELQRRLDLRETLTVTIDPEDAKDFDDAISVARSAEGFRLGVHIADVAQHVRPGSEIDREALARANSVYLPGKAIPMLPPRLTEEVTCLRPKEDRLAVSAIMDIDETGKVTSTKISRSVIHSDLRLTYGRASAILEDPDRATEPEPVVEMLIEARELALLLRRLRLERGAIELSLPEAAVILDIDGSVSEIVKAKRDISHSIIEEFMLLANEQVARFITRKKVPQILRTHEDPEPDDLAEFAEFARSLGLPVKRDPGRIDLQKILSAVEGKPIEQAVSFALLRSLKQARYSAEYGPHYALALEYYTHFTSPIRRYSDLVTHRLLMQALKVEEFRRKEELRDYLPQVAQHCSESERRAEKAEREFVKLRSCLFLQEREGEVFEGIISGVQEFGLFVQLEEPPVEGLLHVSSLGNDRFEYYRSQIMLRGRRSGATYRIGTPVRVRLQSVNVEKRFIDFELS